MYEQYTKYTNESYAECALVFATATELVTSFTLNRRHVVKDIPHTHRYIYHSN